ncbi:MAG TPA: VWA domain-containing protein [Polyangiaceae bacterium]|nr:VWA domain-containing protein [Polyangiaceae bacterium]
MTIEQADPRLTAYVFGELSEQERVALEAELESDDAARAAVTEIQRTVATLRADFSANPSPQLEEKRREEIVALADGGRRKTQRRLLWAAGVLGGMAASLLLLSMVLSRRESEPVAYLPSAAQLDAPSAVVPLTPHDSVAEPSALVPEALEAVAAEVPMNGYSSRSPLSGDRTGPSSAPIQQERTRPLARPAPTAAVPSVGAGEWDDNANYREFMRWLATEPARAAHRIDIRDRRFLVVRDAAGLGVPNCRVVVADESDRQAEFVTAATGRAILFPHAEGLTGPTLTAITECAGGASKRFSISGADGVVELRTPERRILPAEQTIDVAFILDSTGSMTEEIAAVKATIVKVAGGLRDSNVRIRIGLVEFKDRGDPFVTRIYPMSTDLERFSAQVASVQAAGGGDTPESGNEALHVGIQQLAWSDAALARLAFLVGDAPPHLDYPQDYDYALEARTAAHRGIQIYTVAASGMDTLGQVVWRQVAQYTGATNLFVLRGGAGPQSTGAGDPKSSCGGTQTAYTSGNLDALVLAKIQGALRSLERDPLRIPGLNTDENAKPCADRVLIAQ